MNLYDIIEYVRQLKKEFCTNNPYKIAEYYDIKIIHRDTPIRDFTAYTIEQKLAVPLTSMNNYLLKTIIEHNLEFKH